MGEVVVGDAVVVGVVGAGGAVGASGAVGVARDGCATTLHFDSSAIT